jgi:hypothetical protein
MMSVKYVEDGEGRGGEGGKEVDYELHCLAISASAE